MTPEQLEHVNIRCLPILSVDRGLEQENFSGKCEDTRTMSCAGRVDSPNILLPGATATFIRRDG